MSLSSTAPSRLRNREVSMDTGLTAALFDLQRRVGQLVADYVGTRPSLLLPNLRPTHIAHGLAPNMQISVEIENSGDIPTTYRCWVLLELTVSSLTVPPQGWNVFGICDPVLAHER